MVEENVAPVAAGQVNSRNVDHGAFPKNPPEIPGTSQTIDTEVVVVGAGIAGLTAAVSAAESGAKTVLLEKGAHFNVRGLHNAALSSRLQRQAGIEIDKDNVIATIMEFGGYRADQKIVKLWADHCSQVMDWLIDLAEESGVEVILDPTTKDWYFPNYPIIHVFLPNRQQSLAQMLLDKARALGVDVHFNTPAVRLIRENNGRVNGLIAKTEDDNHILFKAHKAVDYVPAITEVIGQWCPNIATGTASRT